MSSRCGHATRAETDDHLVGDEQQRHEHQHGAQQTGSRRPCWSSCLGAAGTGGFDVLTGDPGVPARRAGRSVRRVASVSTPIEGFVRRVASSFAPWDNRVSAREDLFPPETAADRRAPRQRTGTDRSACRPAAWRQWPAVRADNGAGSERLPYPPRICCSRRRVSGAWNGGSPLRSS